ncbi:MAG TPA: glucose-6-phosphate dehydrogenase assembly protein OpcA [Acidimicrobiales bacterium]|jgi:glucose-6-phosphate dehydrogenase assembly protein OpcA|nr:glucose-6-phosphate dehydrogenase assembly protein OpcA [Acidimicrobiales bacterium]
MAHTMSGVVPDEICTLSVWSEDAVRLSDVLAALEAMRKPEPMPPTRTSVLTLVVVATKASSADRAEQALHELGGRHPARVLTLLVDRDTAAAHAPGGLDAHLTLLGSEAEGHPVWFEDVRLTVRGRVIDHLDSLVEPFTIPDLPVVVWFVDGLPTPDEALLEAADVVLVDARDFGDTDCFATLAELRARPLVDLSWHRLRPWRELLASLFERPDTRPFLRGVRSVRVAGRTGPRHLLAGWIADRLQVPTPEVHLEPAEHVSIEVICEIDGRHGRFEVVRTSDERVVRARASVTDGATSEALVPLPDLSPAWGLASALSSLDRDEVYEGALAKALVLASR